MFAKMLNRLSFFALFLLTLVGQVFAAVDFNGDCINYTDSPDPRCRYMIVGSSQIVGLYIEDVPHSGIAVPGRDLYIYAPDAGANAIEFSVIEPKPEHTVVNGEKQTTPADGYVRVVVSADDAVSNSPLGVTVDNIDYAVIYVYNFYLPEMRFCEDAACKNVITDVSKIQLKVGDTLQVYVDALISVGPEKGELVPDLNEQFIISGANSNLVFLTEGKTPLGSTKINGSKVFLGELKKSKSTFLITSETAISKVDFDFNTYPVDDGNGNYTFKVSETFPGTLQFVNHDLPTLDSAAIFDSNGDGIGDSIAAYFDGQMKGISFDDIKYNWPDGEKYITYDGGEKVLVGSVLEMQNVKSTLPKDAGKGTLKLLATSSVSGASGKLESPITDRIGPVIQAATSIKGNGSSKSDTLIIRFNKEIDSSWTSGSSFLLNGVPVSMSAVDKAVDGDEKVWKFVVPTGTVKNGDEIELATSCEKGKCPDGLIQAADGNKVGKNNPIKISDSGHNSVDNERNGFFDKNGDGTMDSATIAFETPITKKDLENMDVSLYWADNQGNVLKITPDLLNSKFVNLSEDGLLLSIDIDSSKYDVKRMLTHIDTTGIALDSLKYGYATVEKQVIVDKDTIKESYDCVMHDRMSPVISGTFLQPESFQRMEADVLTISFSEPVDKEPLSDLNTLSDCFSFRVDGEWISIPFSSLIWAEDGKSVKLHLQNGVELAERLNPADSIKFDVEKAKLADIDGNGVSKNTLPVIVKGDPRVLMQTTSLASLDRAILLADRAAFTERFVPADEPMDEEMKKSLGVLMDISFATITNEDSTGTSEINLDDVGLKWELKVFTNLGAYVGGASSEIKCSDKSFEGNCFEHAKKLYLRWNMRADNGRKVGVGVYVALFKVNVYGAKNAFKIERIYKWGIRAGKGGLSLDD